MWGAEGALVSGVQVLAVGMEGADREQLRRMVTSEDPRYIYYGSDLAELEGELTDDLCTIISTKVGAGVPWGMWSGSSPMYAGGSLSLGSHRLVFSCQPVPKPKPCTVTCPKVSFSKLCHAVLCHRRSAWIRSS